MATAKIQSQKMAQETDQKLIDQCHCNPFYLAYGLMIFTCLSTFALLSRTPYPPQTLYTCSY